MKFCEYMKSDWFQGLQREVGNSTKADVAKQMGICRAKLSQVMNGCGQYGTGAASTTHIEREYRRTFEQLTCPHTQAQVGIEHCREYALSAAPTQNPIRMMQWQSCQQCPNKPKPLLTKKVVPSPPARKIGRVGVLENEIYSTTKSTQQAGIIDKVTLPLPEVGAPQVMEVV